MERERKFKRGGYAAGGGSTGGYKGSHPRGPRDDAGSEARPYRNYRRDDRDSAPSESWNRPAPRTEGGDWHRSSRFGAEQRESYRDDRAPAPKPVIHAAPVATPVSAQKLKAGIVEAKRAIADLMKNFSTDGAVDYDITELEVPVSFAADGRFIGFGEGGSVCMRLKISQLIAEDILIGDNEDDDEDDDQDDAVTIINHGNAP